MRKRYIRDRHVKSAAQRWPSFARLVNQQALGWDRGAYALVVLFEDLIGVRRVIQATARQAGLTPGAMSLAPGV